MGEQLGAFLLSGDVGQEWKRLATGTQLEFYDWTNKAAPIRQKKRPTVEDMTFLRNPPSLRTYIDLPVDDKLRQLPWELARAPQPLVLKQHFPIIRYLAADGHVPREPDWDIRLLIIFTAQDLDSIKAVDEVRAIRLEVHDANRIIDIEQLRNPSLETMRRRIEEFRPHILHFIGHSTRAGLKVYDGEGKANVNWGPNEIDFALGNAGWAPVLAFLNACQTNSLDEQEAVWDVGQAFIRNGTQAFIGMQADVRGEMAGLCAGAFYHALASGLPIDAALASGRGRVAERKGLDRRDAYLPVLTVTLPPDQILRRKDVRVEPSDSLTDSLKFFVNRSEQRRRLLSAPESDRSPVIVVSGEGQIGKSSLLTWCTDGWLRRDFAVRYVNLAGCDDWLEVLRTIRDGHPTKRGPLHAPLDDNARSYFNWRLNNIANGIVRPEGTAPANERDLAGSLDRLSSAIPEVHIHVLEAFHEALLLMAKNRRLVLALDQFDAGDHGLSSAYFGFLRTHWLDKFVLTGSKVHVVLGLKDDNLVSLGLNISETEYEREAVGKFNDYTEHACELFVLSYGEEKLALFRQGLQWVPPGPISGAELKDLCDAFGLKIFRQRGS